MKVPSRYEIHCVFCVLMMVERLDPSMFYPIVFRNCNTSDVNQRFEMRLLSDMTLSPTTVVALQTNRPVLLQQATNFYLCLDNGVNNTITLPQCNVTSVNHRRSWKVVTCHKCDLKKTYMYLISRDAKHLRRSTAWTHAEQWTSCNGTQVIHTSQRCYILKHHGRCIINKGLIIKLWVANC